MNFPEKPIATAGLGIVCALALLAFLSWPGFFGNSLNGSSFTPSANVAESRITSTTLVLSSTSASEAAPANYSLGGVTNIVSTAATTTATESSIVQVTTVLSATTMSGTPVITQPVYAVGASQSLSAKTGGSFSYLAFSVLAMVSVTIAVGSMLFMKRRISAE